MYLLINPIVKTAHYKYYFNCSHVTALRYLKIDCDSLGKDKLTFQDFYGLYGGFPDPKYIPKWKEIESFGKKQKVS